jgi:CRP-like cAMP-binding protein
LFTGFESMFATAAIKGSGARKNKILAKLPDDDYNRVLSFLKPVSLSFGEVISEPDDEPEYIYFPTTCIISLFYTMENGATAEVGLVGNDGLLGIAVIMGGKTMPSRAIIQYAGSAFRMRVEPFSDEFNRARALHVLLLHYTQAFLTQVTQTAVCNLLHPVENRLCRWLLLASDSVGSNELVFTQEFIASMLGVRRESVTRTAHEMQKKGLITYVRGHITIHDRAGLMSCAGECYRVVKREYDRLLD